tara:strand:- start:22935 stop:25259 length:2325 start_codon:yes stop_codon:yes gene_type:complete
MASDTVVQYVLKVDSKAAQKGLDGTAKEANQLSKSLDKVDDESKDATRSLKKAGDQSKKTTGGFVSLQTSVANSAKSIGKFGAVAIGAVATVGALSAAYVAAGKAAFDFTRHVVDSVNDLNDLSAQSALSAQSIQAVRVAFEGSGQSAESASAFIKRFPRLMADLEAGTGRASEAAAKLGIELRSTSGEMKSSDQILRETISSLQQIENDTERTTTAFLLLGRNAGQLLQAFGKTSNFENFLALSEEFGVKTGPEASAAAGQFQELLAALSVVVDGTKQAFVEAVGGVGFFNKFLLRTLKLVAGLQVLLTDNKETINEFSNAMVEVGRSVIDLFVSMFSGLENFIAEAVSFMVMKLTTPLFILNQIGAISDETFAKIENVGMATNKAGLALEEMATSVKTSSENAVSAGERVEELIQKILGGLEFSSKRATLPVEDLTEAIDGAGKAADKSAALFLDLNKAVPDALQLIDDIGVKFSGVSSEILAAQETVSKLENAILDLQIAGLGSTKAQGLLIQAEERLAEAREVAKNKAEEAAKRDRINQLQGGISKFATLASLDAASIVSLINPLAGALVGVLQDIGSTTPEEKQAQIKAQVEAIRLGISFLPEIFLQLIPLLAVGILEAFYDGILLFGRNLFQIIKDAFASAFSFRDRDPDGNRPNLGIRDAIGRFFDPDQQTFMGGGRFVPSAQGGIRFTGMQDGLATLHRGEFVVPQSGQRPQQVDRQLNNTTGGGMTININSAVVDRNAVDALVREIEIRFNNQFGTSSSSLFGGR